MLRFDFTECITNTFPNKPTKDLLQIYSSEKDDKPNDRNFIPHGYLKAANLIIEKMYSEFLTHKKNIFYDYYALPILNLYVNATEFSLKLLKEKLNEHRKKSKCEIIRSLPNQKNLNHELIPLLNDLKLIFPISGSLNVLENFGAITDFVTQIEKYGITCISTRYLTAKNKEIYSLFSKNTYINFRKLSQNVTAICYSILEFIEGEHFQFCSAGEFTKKRLSELKLSRALFIKCKNLFMQGKSLDQKS